MKVLYFPNLSLKQVITLLMLVCFGLLLPKQVLMAQTEAEKKALLFLNHLQLGQSKEAWNMLDSTVQQKINAHFLAVTWMQISDQLGQLKDTNGFISETNQGKIEVHIGCIFEKQTLDFKTILDPDHLLIEGFFVVPEKSKLAWRMPKYAKPERFRERDFPLKNGSFELPGKLCVPQTTEKVPVVIIAHGSGPQGMDGDLGPNKTYKDLAYGLASEQIASYRFDKRTKVYGLQSSEHPDSLKLADEFIDDIRAIIHQLHASKEFSEVWLLGHSLSAGFAPAIANHLPTLSHLKGIIMLGAPFRPLDSLVLVQLQYLASLQTENLDDWQQKINEYKEELSYLRSTDFNLDADAKFLPLQLPAVYWMELISYQPALAIQQLSVPALVLQADDDYQVPLVEFESWKAAAGKKKNIRFIRYKGLNHGFMPSLGKKGAAQYEHATNVDQKVIQDIVRFVKKN